MKKLIPLIGLGFLVGGLLAWGLIRLQPGLSEFNPGSSFPEGSQDEDSLAPDSAPRVGSIAPDFELQTYDGRTVTLSDLKGFPVLINFWATWCGPCRIEMPAIQSKFVAHAPDLKVLAVNFNEPTGEVAGFAQELDLEFDLLLDPDGRVNEQAYLVRAYPSSFFVDRDGVIQVVHLGLMTEGQLDDYLKRLGLN